MKIALVIHPIIETPRQENNRPNACAGLHKTMNQYDSFEAMPLAAPIQRALREQNYSTPSPIQAQAIPHLLEGRDILASAQTGTGKTAAFALPLLHRMAEQPRKTSKGKTRALVLTPTRELAIQVGNSFKTYGRHLDLVGTLIFGGVNMSPQIRSLKEGVDVTIATPGRLLDLHNQGFIDFSEVEYFVLDEADRMLDMGFINDIRKIVKELPQKRQSLFFSATLSTDITRLSETILKDPIDIRIAPQTMTADKVDHRVCFIDQQDKLQMLQGLLEGQEQKEGRNLTLVFSRTKHGADRIVKQLKAVNVRAESIHGNKTQGARQRALENFRSGKSRVLIATDVAARGIDVKNVTLVVNYDLPDEAESYVHRIGRTARAGELGYALSFCTGNDFKELHAVEKLIRQEIMMLSEHPFHQDAIAHRRAKKPQGKNGKGRPSKQKFRSSPNSKKPSRGKQISGDKTFVGKNTSKQRRSNRSRKALSHA